MSLPQKQIRQKNKLGTPVNPPFSRYVVWLILEGAPSAMDIKHVIVIGLRRECEQRRECVSCDLVRRLY